MELNEEQQQALEILSGSDNVFLTGAAGSGKSHTLKAWLAERRDVPILASTGAAAILVGGRTFHGFFGLGIMAGGPEVTVNSALSNPKVVRRVRGAYTIVIDEISMISGPTLACAEQIAREAKSFCFCRNECGCDAAENADKPWGGMRVIVVGDFSQLPPINKDSKEREWAFKHDVWKQSNFKPIMLKKVMRTTDAEFLTVLNKIRVGQLDIPTMQWLDQQKIKRKTNNILRLFSHRTDTERYNLEMLAQLPHQLHSFETLYAAKYGEDKEKTIERRQKDFPINARLQVKLDALVMMRFNDPAGAYVNGSLGTITEIHPGDDETDPHIKIKIERTGDTIITRVHKFEAYDKEGDVEVTAENFPFTLAWASTIHKSQGMTVDRMLTDISRLWEPGQAYVALSRCRSAEGLFIENWNPRSIFADREVLKFYSNIEANAQAASQQGTQC